MRAPNETCSAWRGVFWRGAWGWSLKGLAPDNFEARLGDRRDGDPSVREPERFTAGDARAVYLFGETRALDASAFQSALALTVLLPESFRGGCSFGAEPRVTPRAARSLPSGCFRHGRDLSTGGGA